MTEDRLTCGCFTLFLVVAIIIGGIFTHLNYKNPEVVEGVVVNSYIKRYDESDYFHHVVEYDDGSKEVLQNRDALWLGKFNSADLEFGISEGERYRFHVRGSRIHFFSMFRNIISYTPIEE